MVEPAKIQLSYSFLLIKFTSSTSVFGQSYLIDPLGQNIIYTSALCDIPRCDNQIGIPVVLTSGDFKVMIFYKPPQLSKKSEFVNLCFCQRLPVNICCR